MEYSKMFSISGIPEARWTCQIQFQGVAPYVPYAIFDIIYNCVLFVLCACLYSVGISELLLAYFCCLLHSPNLSLYVQSVSTLPPCPYFSFQHQLIPMWYPLKFTFFHLMHFPLSGLNCLLIVLIWLGMGSQPLPLIVWVRKYCGGVAFVISLDELFFVLR